jgi:hypothetical protein
MSFANSRRADVVAKNPGKPVTEISKLLGAEWRSLSDAEKGKWKAKEGGSSSAAKGGSKGGGGGCGGCRKTGKTCK